MRQPRLGSIRALLVMNVLSALASPDRFFSLALVLCNGQKLITSISCVLTEHTALYRSEILCSHDAFKEISVYVCTSCFAVNRRLQTCRHSSVNSSINVS